MYNLISVGLKHRPISHRNQILLCPATVIVPWLNNKEDIIEALGALCQYSAPNIPFINEQANLFSRKLATPHAYIIVWRQFRMHKSQWEIKKPNMLCSHAFVPSLNALASTISTRHSSGIKDNDRRDSASPTHPFSFKNH